MQALLTRPGEAHSTHVEDVSEPTGDGVLVRVLEVGVCGTDREISEGLFGAPPEGRDLLVLGHEMLGVIEQDGDGFTAGDLVTSIVRRSCGHCVACAENAPDSCLTGDYVERGITRLDGFARERLREDPRQLIGIPASLGRLGVLAEPASVCARALRHAHDIGGRQPWQLETALVIGGGAVGTLMTLLLRLDGIAVTVASLERANDRISALGARYACSDGINLRELGQFDLVVEAAGDAQLMADTLGLLRRNGVACLLGIDGRAQRVSVDGPTLGVDMLLGNRVLFGSVNAQRRDWLAAVDALDRAQDKWRDVLESFISLRVPLDRFAEAFAHKGGKATLVLEQ
ncbi:MAG TPA: alcohol dehydrogenase catalytic domain-containing protein [Gaiellaceae bacterium]|jgi:threonine dehydrogenase-like Zn-dependent dehydrogenase|nr:alcohol dehydrogenase catalytic domain-containing protein [Gaiellaceae bacterium]